MKSLTLAFVGLLALASVASAGWEYDLALADKLLEGGYYDAAIQDYQKLVMAYPDQAPATDRAWYGMGRAFQATGNLEASKTALEKVLERNKDTEAAAGARSIYRQMKEEAKLQKTEMERAFQYYDTRYRSTSWLYVITKVFDWFDLRRAKKQLAKATEADDAFNPRYLVEPPTVPQEPVAEIDVTSADLNKVLTEASVDADVSPTVVGEGDAPTPTVDVAAAATPAPSVTETTPTANLALKRDLYLAAYRSLQDALRGKNQAEIQRANEAFQKAVAEYKAAQQEVAAAQGR